MTFALSSPSFVTELVLRYGPGSAAAKRAERARVAAGAKGKKNGKRNKKRKNAAGISAQDVHAASDLIRLLKTTPVYEEIGKQCGECQQCGETRDGFLGAKSKRLSGQRIIYFFIHNPLLGSATQR